MRAFSVSTILLYYSTFNKMHTTSEFVGINICKSSTLQTDAEKAKSFSLPQIYKSKNKRSRATGMALYFPANIQSL